jgi:hypothetical protein
MFASIAFICYSSYSIKYLTGTLASLYKNLYDEYKIIDPELLLNISSSTSQLNYSRSLNFSSQNASQKNEPIQVCPLIPPNLGTRINVNLKRKHLNEIEREFRLNHTDLRLGGRWSPEKCLSRYKVAIVVPYRDRLENLELFLMHMHPFLKKQQLEYGIYLVEPLANLTFNRGKLFMLIKT